MTDTAPSSVITVHEHKLPDGDEVHAVLPADVAGADATATVCDLPLSGFTGGAVSGIRFAQSLPLALAAGVTCELCLGWLGAFHTTPPVVVRSRWAPPFGPPALPGETDEAFTNRLTGADRSGLSPYDHRRNRQCSIGYHDECTDPSGHRCECPCHRQPTPGTVVEVDGEDYIVVPPEQPTTHISKIMDDVLDELMRARAKFPGQHLPLGFGETWWPVVTLRHPGVTASEARDVLRAMTDQAADCGRLTWRHVLAEEFGEALAEDDTAKARTELVQLAAMCVRTILDIDDPQPIHYTGPSGVVWDQVGTDPDGHPVLARDVNEPLTPSGAAAPTSVDATGGTDA